MKNLLPLKSLLSFALLVCSTNISANKIISVSDFGLKPEQPHSMPYRLYKKQSMPANNIPAPRLSFPRGDMTFGHSTPLKEIITKRILTMSILKSLPYCWIKSTT